MNYEQMPMEGLCDHLQNIQQAIQCEYLENEGANGLTVYLEQKNLKRKVLTMIPSAELWDSQIWSGLEIRATETITKEEEEIEKMRWVKTLIAEKTGGTQQITTGTNENLCIRSSETCQAPLSLAMVWNHKSGRYDCDVKGYTHMYSGYQNAEGVKKLAEAYQQIGELIDLIVNENITMTEEELQLLCREIAEEELVAGPELQTY
mgnify:CR=1 FL=1